MLKNRFFTKKVAAGVDFSLTTVYNKRNIAAQIFIFRKGDNKTGIFGRRREKETADISYIIKIDGMRCAHCANAVKKALEARGAADIAVDLAQRSASLRCKAEVTEQALKAAIEDAGYTVVEIIKK